MPTKPSANEIPAVSNTLTTFRFGQLSTLRVASETASWTLLVADAREVAGFGRNGIYDVTVTSGEQVVAEFRGDSRTIARP